MMERVKNKSEEFDDAGDAESTSFYMSQRAARTIKSIGAEFGLTGNETADALAVWLQQLGGDVRGWILRRIPDEYVSDVARLMLERNAAKSLSAPPAEPGSPPPQPRLHPDVLKALADQAAKAENQRRLKKKRGPRGG